MSQTSPFTKAKAANVLMFDFMSTYKEYKELIFFLSKYLNTTVLFEFYKFHIYNPEERKPKKFKLSDRT